MKEKLALLGGTRAINFIGKHFSWPQITKEMEVEVIDQLYRSISIYDRSGIVEEFENSFAKYHNCKHALLTNSGTSALHSLYVGSNLEPGDEVICPAYTFFATVTPLLYTGAVPVLVDCKEDCNIDPTEIEKKVTINTKAIVVTHMWGLPCEMDAIIDIAKKYNLILLEDVSHAHGATYKGKKTGTFGHGSAFSLQGQKTITSGEGGVVLTNNDDLFYKALLLGHYNKRCKKEIPLNHPLFKYSTTGMGLKFHAHPLGIVVAKNLLKDLDSILEAREKNALKLYSQLVGLPGITVSFPPSYLRSSWYAFIIQYNPEELNGLPIEMFFDALIAEGCLELDKPNSTCPLNYHPLFQDPKQLFPQYDGKFKYHLGDFPTAEKLHKCLLKLPVWHLSEDTDIINAYAKAFTKVIYNHEQLL